MDGSEIVISEIYCFIDFFYMPSWISYILRQLTKNMVHLLSSTSVTTRCKIVTEIGKALEAKLKPFSELVAHEVGKPLTKAIAEVKVSFITFFTLYIVLRDMLD